MNGDGFDDLLIGALPIPTAMTQGASYVVFGKAGGFAPTLNLSTLNGANGFKINGVAALDYSGSSVSTAGDVNGDGFDDLLIGAGQLIPTATIAAPATLSLGRAVRFPRRSIFPRSMAPTASRSTGWRLAITRASVSGAGDVNGDGFDDLLIGASQPIPTAPAAAPATLSLAKPAGLRRRSIFPRSMAPTASRSTGWRLAIRRPDRSAARAM